MEREILAPAWRRREVVLGGGKSPGETSPGTKPERDGEERPTWLRGKLGSRASPLLRDAWARRRLRRQRASSTIGVATDRSRLPIGGKVPHAVTPGVDSTNSFAVPRLCRYRSRIAVHVKIESRSMLKICSSMIKQVFEPESVCSDKDDRDSISALSVMTFKSRSRSFFRFR